VNKVSVLPWTLAVFAASSFLHAQSPPDQRPSEPILKRAPSIAEWTITFRSDRDKALKGVIGADSGSAENTAVKKFDSLKSLTVSKSGATYREIFRESDGPTTEKWIADGLQVYETTHSKMIARSILPSSSYSDNYSDYRRSDFEELEWVSPQNFVGIKDLNGRKVFEFRVDSAERKLTPRELSNMADPDFNESPAHLQSHLKKQAGNSPGFTAFLDITTQLPVWFDDGQTGRIYEFSNSPSASLSIPSRFAAELNAWKKDIYKRPLPRP